MSYCDGCSREIRWPEKSFETTFTYDDGEDILILCEDCKDIETLSADMDCMDVEFKDITIDSY